MNLLNTIFESCWLIFIQITSVFYESSVYVLIGFLLAGLLNEFISMAFVAKHLGKPGLKGIIWATLLGAPLPLCSCGVLPAAVTLRKNGASKPATAAFILSVPETGVDSVAITYGLMGPFMAVYRPIVAIVTAISAAIACLFITRHEKDDKYIGDDIVAHAHDHGHDHGHSHGHDHHDCDHDHHAPITPPDTTQEKPSVRARLKSIIGYGFKTVLDDVAFWIFTGLVVTGIMLALLPEDFFTSFVDNDLLLMLLMAVIGIPLYTCASMSTPIAAGLVATGLSPGAALVYLLVGPATSIASLSIVGKLLGRQSMLAYLAAIFCVAIIAGLLLDAIAADEIRQITTEAFKSNDGFIVATIKTASAIVFFLLFLSSLMRKSYRAPISDIKTQSKAIYQGMKHVSAVNYTVLATLFVALLISLTTFKVGPGQQGMILRFGQVVEANLPPGLYHHYPWPIDATRIIDTSLIRSSYIAESTETYLTSDENVVSITSVIQYRVNNAYDYAFISEQNTQLLKDMARRILVTELISRPINEIFTTKRLAVEKSYKNHLAKEIAALNQGFELVDARLIHVHSPEEVHYAFRDVSSALEDRQRLMFEADGKAIEAVTNAEGEYAKSIAISTGDAKAAIEVAKGRAESFLPQSQAYHQSPEITRFRLKMEAIEDSFQQPVKYFNTVKNSQSVDLWIDPNQEDVIKFKYRE